MKKICVITTVHSLCDPRIFYKEARSLFSAGYDVTLIAQSKKNDTLNGIKVVSLSRPSNRLSRILFLSKKAYDIALNLNVDIYHFHDPELIPWMLLLKYKTKSKIIYDVHEDGEKDVMSKEWIPLLARRLISKVFNTFEKIISKKFDYVITATSDIANNFKQKNVIDISNYPIISSEISKQKSNYRNNLMHTLIYVGGLERIRGIKEIVESLEYLDNIRLKLVGSFSENNFKDDVIKLKGWEKVEFVGKQPFEKIPYYLNESDIGVVCLHPLSNYLTSLPTKMFEYMGAGIPVIASNFPLWRKILSENKCGLTVNPLDAKEIAKAILYLIENPNESRKMGENGRKAVLENYNWENESRKLLEVYKKLCAE